LSTSRLGCFFPRERAPSAYWIRGWVGSAAGLDDVEKRKFSNPSVIQPVASRYTDCTIPAPKFAPVLNQTPHHDDVLGSGGESSRILNLSIRMEENVQLHLPEKVFSRTCQIVNLDAPRDFLDMAANEVTRAPAGNLTPVVKPVHNQDPDWAIPVTHVRIPRTSFLTLFSPKLQDVCSCCSSIAQ
jgi:hypothetical protein